MTSENDRTDVCTLTWMFGSRVNKIMSDPMCVYAVISDVKSNIRVGWLKIFANQSKVGDIYFGKRT